jgi:hypothetical protein
MHRIGMLNSLRAIDAQAWNRASRTLASMKGLKTLEIKIWGCTISGGLHEWSGIRQLLDLLRRVQTPKNYTVTIDELDAEDLVKEYHDAPFKLEYGHDDRELFSYG